MSKRQITYPRDGHNGSKEPLIPGKTPLGHPSEVRGGGPSGFALWDRSTSYQLVGGVMAHQGNDGYPG